MNADEEASGSAGPSVLSAGDYSTPLQLNADEESQFSAFSSGHSATIFVVDASTDMLRTQLAGTNRSQSAFQWALTAVLTSVRQLVFSNRNDHVGLVFFGCRQEAHTLLKDEEFHDDSDELSMRTAHTVMYLHKAGLDTLRALYKLSKIDDDKIEHECESLTPGGDGSSSSVRIVVGEALWKVHRMFEYANQWFASKRVVILTVTDDPHGITSSNGKNKNSSSAESPADLSQKFTCDRAERLHEAGTEVFVVPFKLSGDAEFDMGKLYGKIQKIKSSVKSNGAGQAILEISPDNVDEIESRIETLVESPIIKRPLCALPLRLSSDCALPLVIYHPITKFTKLPLLWLKSQKKSGAAGNSATTSGRQGLPVDADDDDAGAAADEDEADAEADADPKRMHEIKRKRVFVDPATSDIVPNDEIKRRMWVLGREIIFSQQEAKSWKEFDVPTGMDVLASCPLYLAQRFIWKNYIKPTLLVTVKLTGDVKDQTATLKVFRSLLDSCQSHALIVRYTPPSRFGTTRIALLLPDIAVAADGTATAITETAEEENGTQKTTQRKNARHASAAPSCFQMFIVPYIQELRDVVDKLYERSEGLVQPTGPGGQSVLREQQQHLVAKYAEIIEALQDDWTPHKYRNPAVYQYYLNVFRKLYAIPEFLNRLEAQVCKWSKSEIPQEVDDPTIPDYDRIEELAGAAIAELKQGGSSRTHAGTKSTARGGRRQQTADAAPSSSSGATRGRRGAAASKPPAAAAARGGRRSRASVADDDDAEEVKMEENDEEAAAAPVTARRGRRGAASAEPTVRGRGRRGGRASVNDDDIQEAKVEENDPEEESTQEVNSSKRPRRHASPVARAAAAPSVVAHRGRRGAASAEPTGRGRGRRSRATTHDDDVKIEEEEIGQDDTTTTSHARAAKRKSKSVSPSARSRKSAATALSTRGGRRGRGTAAHDGEHEEEEINESTSAVHHPATKRTRKNTASPVTRSSRR